MTYAPKVDASDDQTTIRQRLFFNPVLLDFLDTPSIDEAILGKREWRSHYYVNGAHCVRSYHLAIPRNDLLHLKYSGSSVATLFSPHCHLGHVMLFSSFLCRGAIPSLMIKSFPSKKDF